MSANWTLEPHPKALELSAFNPQPHPDPLDAVFDA